ncbi:MAG TPA: hypothetical protein VEL09_03775 [Burkholderiales bacterium]|nr:hypothetical protein [Burkholderiales bacterium]
MMKVTALTIVPGTVMQGLERALTDTYFCNFLMFQSLPDIWAVVERA